MDSESLYDAYNKYFKVIRADSPELLDEVFRLRYQVYCIEHKFENQHDFPDGRSAMFMISTRYTVYWCTIQAGPLQDR